MKQYDIRLAKVPQPPKDCTGEPVMLTDATIQERLDKVLQGMKNRGLEQLVVYGDAEHCGNFQYLMGYFTRFEEALLVLDANGTAHFVLGNENLNKRPKPVSRGRPCMFHSSRCRTSPTVRIRRCAPCWRKPASPRADALALRAGNTLPAGGK